MVTKTVIFITEAISKVMASDLQKDMRKPNFIAAFFRSFDQSIKYPAASSLSTLPSEILRIILYFFASSVIELLKFGAVGREYREIVSDSELWLKVPLVFYAPLKYVITQNTLATDVNNISNVHQFIDDCIREQLFREIKLVAFDPYIHYAPGCRVSVLNLNTNQVTISSPFSREFALRLRQWWVPIYVKYNRLWHWYANWIPFYRRYYQKSFELKKSFAWLTLISLLLGIVSTVLLCYCESTDLSPRDVAGMILLIVNVGIFAFMSIVCIVYEIAEDFQYCYDTLDLKFSWKTIYPHDVFLVLSLGLFTTLLLIFIKCLGGISEETPWWITILPLTICTVIGYGASLRGFDNLDTEELMYLLLFLYFTLAVPTTCMLVALYYDNILTTDFSCTLFPLYPFFFVVVAASVARLMYSLKMIFQSLKNRCENDSFTDGEVTCLLGVVVVLSYLLLLFMNWALIMLVVDSYWMEDDDYWKKHSTDQVLHFTPLTNALIVIFSLPMVMMGIFVEESFYAGS